MREFKFRAWELSAKFMINDFQIKDYFQSVLTGENEYSDDYKVMQFTDLTDINGVDLYGGDVVYLAGYGEYVCEFPFYDLYAGSAEKDIGALIGNIYQNPELNTK